MEKMQRAFKLYPYCSMATNYLANHFFLHWSTSFLSQQLTETALAVTDHGETRLHSYYNLSCSHQCKDDYETASRYYWAFVKETNNPNEFVFPYCGLQQVQLKLGDIKNGYQILKKFWMFNSNNSKTLKVISHIHAQLGLTRRPR